MVLPRRGFADFTGFTGLAEAGGGEGRGEMKLYGGHGPVSETTTPFAPMVLACRPTAARNDRVRDAGTRNAASRSRREPGAACSVAVRRRESTASLVRR